MVRRAGTGEEALDHVVTFQPDVVLLDLTLPSMTGGAVLDELRREHAHLPVIVMTGDPARAQGTAARGATACLLKPFNLEALAQTVHEVLEDRA
jgi:CheY-like chemotaxis protein